MNNDNLNSKEYWDHRFETDWEAMHGREQSQFFARLALEHLPSWFFTLARTQEFTFCDWGCAEGDGTKVLSSYFGPDRVCGIDFSAKAIEKARRFYTDIQFVVEDWLTDTESKTCYDVVFSSNTLEHFRRPYEVLNRLLGRAGKCVVLLLPFREYDLHPEHYHTFVDDNIPFVLSSEFLLAHAQVLNSKAVMPAYWQGEQILLIYARGAFLREAGFTLSQITLYDKQVAMELGERETQVSSLTQTVAERDERIAGLIEESDKRIADLNATIGDRNNQIAAIVNSWSWKLTGPLRSMNANVKKIAALPTRLWRALGRSVDLFGTFARTARSHGIWYALMKGRASLRREGERSLSGQGITLSNQERYVVEKSAQNNYLTNYLANSPESTHFDLIHEHFASKAVNPERLVIYPLSYPIELTQRPNHIFRALGENGYECIVLSIDANAPFFREIAPHVHLTNLFAAVISYLSNKQVILYITYPFYSYILNHLRRSTVVYDVLDDLSVFSLNCEAMKSDHNNLLECSDVVLFSSQELLKTNRDAVRGNACLVTNGVWLKDFMFGSESSQRKADFRKHPNEYVIGYHGAITELLDWELLEKLAQMPGVRLVLIGPIADFDHGATGTQSVIRERVLRCEQVTHIQTVPYFDLKYYLSGFDAGIVPFVINEKTAPVSPLKLFEYMAMGLKVFATPTKTLLTYAEFITVADSSRILVLVQEAVKNRAMAKRHIDYSKVLHEVDWGTQLKPVITLLEERTVNSSPKSAKPEKTVDIVNVNFYDWDGATLYKGGAERYVYDLASILQEDGWSPRILQVANRSFEKQFRGIPVIGVESGNGHNLRRVSKAYRGICRDSDLVIASPGDLACELSGLKVIAINHGIYWDHKYKHLESAALSEYRNIFDALKSASAFVAVDTNFINWVRTYDYSLAQKLTYIPNYFDGKVFFPTRKNFETKIRVLYPRRLYEARGIFITLKAFNYLFQKHGGLELHLVGQANAEDAKIVSEFCAQYEGRVIWEELDMEDMYKAYGASHIVLIPTMYAEGTSLSCLEAMATNNAVIATNIGGLPNLVVDGFNGFLISPTAEALIRSIESLLVDRGLMQSMASRGIELVAAFEKNRWSRRWRNIITEMTG